MIKKKIKKKIKKETLAHYERMIKWAEKQNDDECAEFDLLSDFMSVEIDETWEGHHCPICKFYYVRNSEGISGVSFMGCGDCPLSLSGNDCNYADSFWTKMDDSKSWSEWIIYAKKLYEVIKQL